VLGAHYGPGARHCLHSLSATRNSGAACMNKSKMSSGRTSAPCRRRRNFSTRWGSGVIGAIAIQAANGSNQIHRKRSSHLSMAVHSKIGSSQANRLLVGQVAIGNSWMFLHGGHRDWSGHPEFMQQAVAYSERSQHSAFRVHDPVGRACRSDT